MWSETIGAGGRETRSFRGIRGGEGLNVREMAQ